MKKLLIAIAVLTLSFAGQAQQYLQGSIKKNVAPTKVDILFKANYTSLPGEYINYLQVAVTIPLALSAGVTATAVGVNTFSNMGTLAPIDPITAGTERVFGWVFAVPALATQSWTNGVGFVGLEVTFSSAAAIAGVVKLVDFTNDNGGSNFNTYYAIVSTTGDVTNYTNFFYAVSGTSQLGTYPNGDQYVQTISATCNAGTVSGSSPLCIGGTATYTSDGDPGGTWSSTNTSVATVNSSTGVVTAVAAGTTDITYTLPCGGSPVSAFKTLTVSPPVSAGTVSGTSPLCIAATATYTSSGSSGGSWSSSNTGVATVNSSTGVVTAVSVGTTNITYTISSGCGSPVSAFQLLTVNPSVNAGTVSGTSPLCIAATATYSSSGDAGGSWSSSNTAVATVNSSTGVVTAVSAGTTNITYTISSGCGSPVNAFKTLTVSPNANAGTVSGTSPLCIAATATYTSSGDAGGTWSSTSPAVATVNSSTGVVTAVSVGTTNITYTVSAGCNNPVSAFKTLTVTAVPTPGTVSGTTPLCIGQTATYTSSGSGGGTWSSSNTSVATVNASTGVVTPVAAGTTNIIYTVNDCAGSPLTALQSLTVSPNVSAGTVSGATPLCIGATATYTSTGTPGGTWSSSNTSVATVVAGTGVVTAVAAGTTNITYTISSGCGSPVSSLQVLTVSPNVTAGTVSGATPLVIGATATYTSSGTPGGSWSSSNPAIATVNSSTGVVTAVAIGTTDITYTVSSGCGSPVSAFQNLTVVIACTPGNISGTATLCIGGTAIYTTDGDPGGTWTSTNTSVATVNSGTGLVTAVAAGTTNITYTLPCGGSPVSSFKTLTVNPTPTVNAVANQTVCNGSATAAITFSGAVIGTVYNWTNNTTSIGLAASGSGNIASFTAVNTGSSPVVATITVTPSYTNAGATCTGASISFIITVNPTPTVNAVANQAVCNNTATTAINFTGTPLQSPGAIYTVAPFNTKIYRIPTGAGNYTATVETPVTMPGFTVNGMNCITVDPTSGLFYVIAKVSAGPRRLGVIDTATGIITDRGSMGDNFSYLTFAPNGRLWGVTGDGASCSECLYSVNKTNAATTYIRTLGNGADGEVICFRPADGFIYHWSGNSTTEYEKIDTTLYNITSIGSYSAPIGNSEVFGATINPVSGNFIINDINSDVEDWNSLGPISNLGVTKNILSNDLDVRGFVFGGNNPGVVFNWTNSAPSIGLAASGTGDIASFTAINSGSTPVVATIIVTPTFTNGGTTCTGTPLIFTITVNPIPNAVATPSSQTICSGSAITTIVNSGSVSGTVYNWTRDNTITVTGIAASGAGNISGSLTNTTNAPITVTFTITPSYTNAGTTCTGTPITATVVVNPVPNAVATPSSQTICSGSAITTIVLSGNVTGTVYNWIRNNTVTVTGIAASGAGNISGTLTNTTNAPVTVTFTITPSYTNAGTTCTGTPVTATVIVNPIPTVNTVTSQTVCNGSATAAITFSGAVTGTVYSWTNTTPSIGLAASGTGNIASFTAINVGTTPVVATINVTPTYTNGGVTCTGTPTSFTITVNPTPTVNAVANQSVCTGSATAAVTFSGTVTGTVFNWTNNTTSIGLAASGTGNIASFTAVNTGTTPVVATITVTPSYTNGGVTCTGTPIIFTITVNPLTSITSHPSSLSVCPGTNVSFTVIAGGVNLSYQWEISTDGGTTWNSISGAIFSNLNLTSVTTAMNNYRYRCIVTGLCGTITSNPATLTVYNPVTITTQPANASVCAGANVTFNIVATGSPTPLAYQWQVSTNGGTTYTNITGANFTSLTLTAVTTAMNANRYQCLVTGYCGTVTSNAAILTVNTSTAVTIAPLPAKICLSDTLIALTGTPAGGTWSGPGVVGNNFHPINTAVGSYVLTYTFTNTSGCISTATVTAVVEDCPERRRLLRNDAVILFPIPNDGQFSMRVNSTLYSFLGMKVYTSDGKLIYNQFFAGLQYGMVLPVDLRRFSAGVYNVKMYYEGGINRSEKTFKIIIAKH